MRFTIILATIAALMSVNTSWAEQRSYSFTWVGSSGFTVSGTFTGSDRNQDHMIRDGEVTSLSFEVWQGGELKARASGRRALRGSDDHPFNFNFDLRTRTFSRGHSLNGSGQLWNYDGPGAGFYSGEANAAIRVDGKTVKASRVWAIRG